MLAMERNYTADIAYLELVLEKILRIRQLAVHSEESLLICIERL